LRGGSAVLRRKASSGSIGTRALRLRTVRRLRAARGMRLSWRVRILPITRSSAVTRRRSLIEIGIGGSVLGRLPAIVGWTVGIRPRRPSLGRRFVRHWLPTLSGPRGRTPRTWIAHSPESRPPAQPSSTYAAIVSGRGPFRLCDAEIIHGQPQGRRRGAQRHVQLKRAIAGGNLQSSINPILYAT
jgi:hypothetical protein